jgi:hypothetical protein
MKALKQLFNFYIISSVHVAFAVVSLTIITYIEFDIKVNYSLLVFTFFASVTGYNFVKYFGVAKFSHRSLTSWLKNIQLFSFLSFIMMLYFATKIDLSALLIILVLAILTFLYAIPFFPRREILENLNNLRAISGLKIYVIALVWAVTVVVFPIKNEHIPINYDIIISTLQRFIFIVVLMIPFEIRDINNDSLKLLTIPQQIGVNRSKIFGVLLLLVFLMLEFLKDEFILNVLLVNFLVTIITSGFLLASGTEQKKYYSAFWVEAVPIYWLLLSLILV